LPYEDSFFVRNELKALKYAQLELLELRQLCSDIEREQIGLHQKIILPLISGVSCGGFYLYATPIIHLPKILEAQISSEF
jgi:hypothetical protein